MSRQTNLDVVDWWVSKRVLLMGNHQLCSRLLTLRIRTIACQCSLKDLWQFLLQRKRRHKLRKARAGRQSREIKSLGNSWNSTSKSKKRSSKRPSQLSLQFICPQTRCLYQLSRNSSCKTQIFRSKQSSLMDFWMILMLLKRRKYRQFIAYQIPKRNMSAKSDRSEKGKML